VKNANFTIYVVSANSTVKNMMIKKPKSRTNDVRTPARNDTNKQYKIKILLYSPKYVDVLVNQNGTNGTNK
jgi:hypothetical protein